MSKTVPGREQGHLMVAAVRVIAHREQHLPSSTEVAELVRQPAEWVAVVLHELVQLGALREIGDAYQVRYEVGDLARLEELPEGAGAAIETELQSFSAKRREKEESLRKRFAGDLESDRKAKFSKLEEELKRFRGGTGRKTNLWGEPVEEPEES